MYEFNVLQTTKLKPWVTRHTRNTSIFFLILIALLFLPWRQTVKGVGVIMPLNPMERIYPISSTVDGFMEEIYVKENQFVKKGAKLFKMKDLDAAYKSRLSSIKEQSIQQYQNEKIKLTNTQDRIQDQERIFRLGVEVYDKKIIQLKNNLSALQEQKVALKNSQEIANSNYIRYKKLFGDGIVSQRDLELERNTYLESKAKYQRIKADIKNLDNQLKITKKESTKYIHEMELKLNTIQNNILNSQNSIESFKQNIERNSVQLSRYLTRTITAKSDGYVIRIYQNDQNKLIKKGEEILLFDPMVTQRSIRLKISDFNMPLIKEGLTSQIIFFGWPAIQISGWPKIQKGTFPGIVQSVERSKHEERFYYVIIVENPKSNYAWPSKDILRIGTKASVWVKLEKVTIWYEIWRLLLAQPPKMVAVANDQNK